MLLIVTNNPTVSMRYRKAEHVEGSPVDVLARVGVLLQEGYRLVAAPLSGNLVMLRNPYRSVLLESSHGEEVPAADFLRVADSYQRLVEKAEWEVPEHTLEDYAFMDEMFLDRAATECGPGSLD
jgi:hypothetical protein